MHNQPEFVAEFLKYRKTYARKNNTGRQKEGYPYFTDIQKYLLIIVNL